MDLIYADKDGIELGIMPECEYDFAFGSDENNFTVTIDRKDNCCEASYLIYGDGTECGGIVDRMNPDTAAGTVTYEGRTWHGIMNGKIIEPEPGKDYRTVAGDANDILRSVIEAIGLSEIFVVPEKESAVKVKKYRFDRYTPAYTGILKMLYRNNGKLQMSCDKGVVHLEAVPLYDYTLDEEWNSNQISFSIKKDFRPVNHLICLGKGDLKERKVIHLFADENGGIQSYKNVENPVKNTDYILSKEKQVLFGREEVADIFDYGNAESVENYVELQEQPENWSRNYVKYYHKTEDAYMLYERSYEDTYTALTSQPDDWSKKYANYFYKSGKEYRNVQGVESDPVYNLQTKEPADWEKRYASYYYYYSDGVTEEYKKVSGDTEKRYNRQTMQPSDWEEDYKRYYIRKPHVKLQVTYKIEGDDGWKKVTVVVDSLDDIPAGAIVGKVKKIVTEWDFINVPDDKVPEWKTKKYYTEESYSVAPKWEKNKYFTESTTISAPAWSAGKFYTLEKNVEVIPAFVPGEVFTRYVDDFADLVENGLEKFRELLNSDSIDISFDSSQIYDINDIVGATEEYTGISVYKRITKKIISSKDGTESIQYEIGE